MPLVPVALALLVVAAPAPAADDGPEARTLLRRADALREAGRPGEALADYLRCLDRGLDPTFVADRYSRLVDGLVALAAEYAPARAALSTRRAAILAELRAGRGTWRDATDLAAFDEKLGEPERTVEAYDAAVAGRAPEEARAVLYNMVVDDLVAARRYEDVLAGGGDLVARVRDRIAMHERTAGLLAVGDGSDDQRLARLKRSLFAECALYYEALVGAGRHADAEAAHRLLSSVDASPATSAALASAEARALAAAR